MLEKIRIQRYKSLYDVTLALAPLTALIGPNGSGKSNVCEAIYVLSKLVEWIEKQPGAAGVNLTPQALGQMVNNELKAPHFQNKLWRGEEAKLQFDIEVKDDDALYFSQEVTIPGHIPLPLNKTFVKSLQAAKTYNFSPTLLAQSVGPKVSFERSGLGIANALADILLNERQRFDELEARFIGLIPNISRIVLERQPQSNQFLLLLKDKYSDYLIPGNDISDGTLRILAFLTALYDINGPRLICFEEPENGIHPWLLNKVVELLNLVSTQGVRGQPVQVLLTTHSPAFLNLLRPEQVRIVELRVRK